MPKFPLPLSERARARLHEVARRRDISAMQAFVEFFEAARLLANEDTKRPQAIRLGRRWKKGPDGKVKTFIPCRDLTADEFRKWFLGRLAALMEDGILGISAHRGQCDTAERIADPTPDALDRLIANEEAPEKQRRAQRAEGARAFAMMLETNPLYTYYRMIARSMEMKKKDIAEKLGWTPARLSMFESRLEEKIRVSTKKSR